MLAPLTAEGRVRCKMIFPLLRGTFLIGPDTATEDELIGKSLFVAQFYIHPLR